MSDFGKRLEVIKRKLKEKMKHPNVHRSDNSFQLRQPHDISQYSRVNETHSNNSSDNNVVITSGRGVSQKSLHVSDYWVYDVADQLDRELRSQSEVDLKKT